MIIKNVHISGFGQFHNRDFSFTPGINLISGHNESGKSTLNNFISHMLYGMNRGRGKASRNDDYTKYCPWNYPDSFGGSMHIEADGTGYLIERSFSASGKAFTITNETTGEQITGDEAFLNRLTGGISENAFNCTLNISESGFNGSGDISELIKKNILNVGCTSSVNINVPLALKSLNSQKKKLLSEIDNEAPKSYYGIEDRLASLKTELVKKHKEIACLPEDKSGALSELEQRNGALSIETEKLMLEYSELKNSLKSKGFNTLTDVTELESTHDRLSTLASHSENDTSKNNTASIRLKLMDTPVIFKDIIHGSVFSICLILSMICFVLDFTVGGILFILAAATAGMYTAYSIFKRLPEASEIIPVLKQRFEASKIIPASAGNDSVKKLRQFYGKYTGIYDISSGTKTLFINYISGIKADFAKLEKLEGQIGSNRSTLSSNTDSLIKLKNSCAENTKLYWESDNLQQQIDSLDEEKHRLELIITENRKLKKEIEALELAADTIKNISSDMHTEHAPELNRKVTRTFNQITSKGRGELFISENMDITLYDGIRTIPAEALSQGTAEQIYMSLRLSAADMLFGEKEFPLIFDEAFSKYDNPRLAQTLKYIHSGHRGQTFIFSCQNRERLILEKLGIPFNYIQL